MVISLTVRINIDVPQFLVIAHTLWGNNVTSIYTFSLYQCLLVVSFSVLGQDFYEPTRPLYSFIAGTDFEVNNDGFPKICQCCVFIVNDDRLERNETFHLI